MTHSPVGPSGAAQRIQCPGSVKMQAQFPEGEPTPEQAEGDAAHWALSQMLSGRGWPEPGDAAPNGVFITDDMLQAVDVAYDGLYKLLKGYGLSPTAGAVEQMIQIPRIHPQAFGTPDYRIWLTPNHLLVFDYKHGHRFVDVFENEQLVDYTAGLLPEDRSDLDIQVTFVICQPRAYHPSGAFRTWTTPASALRALINISSNSAHEALGDSPRTRAGPECRDCRARTSCVTFLKAASQEIEWSGALRTASMQPQDIGLQLTTVDRALARLQAYRTGLVEQAMTSERSGRPVPGWRTQQSTGREQWTVPVEVVADIGALLKLPLVKTVPITPNQAREAGVPPATVAAMSTRGKGSVDLVPDDNSAARRVFG